MAFDVQKIEDKIDKTAAGSMTVDMELGGLRIQTMMEVMEFAKLMSVSGAAVPSHLRGNPGACLAVCTRALRWGMDPFGVAEKTYLVNNKGEERIAYESQLIHAVIEARAPLKGRLRFEIIGEGDERTCKVWGTFKGEIEPHAYLSGKLATLRPAKNEYGKVKGSPLWESQPEVQLFYSASRQWARLYAPDILLGVYSVDELEQGAEAARDVTPVKQSLRERLKAKRRDGARGFDHDHVEREAAVAKNGGVTIEATNDNTAPTGEPMTVAERPMTVPEHAAPANDNTPAAGNDNIQIDQAAGEKSDG